MAKNITNGVINFNDLDIELTDKQRAELKQRTKTKLRKIKKLYYEI